MIHSNPRSALDLERAARELEREARTQEAGVAYLRAAVAARDGGDRAAAFDLASRAFALVPAEPATEMLAELHFLLSELFADRGALTDAATLSLRAESEFQGLGSERGCLAVLTARAIRALEVGDGERGYELAIAILPRVDAQDAPAPRIWLRLHLAIWCEQLEQSVPAVQWATEAMEIAAVGSGEQMVAAAAAMRNLIHLGEAEQAAELGGGILGHPAELAPAELRGEVFLLTATALRALGQEQLAHIFASRATSLTSSGIELARRFYREQPSLSGDQLR